MQEWITAAVGLACITVGLFVGRPFIRRLYAPPAGRNRLRATWILSAGVMAGSFALIGDHGIAGLMLFVSGPAIGLVAMLLCRDAYNRARGLPPDYVEIPEQLGRTRRALFAGLSAGCAFATWWLVGEEGWRAVHAVWVLGGLALGFGAAAGSGRLSARMRQHLGASQPPVDIIDRPANER